MKNINNFAGMKKYKHIFFDLDRTLWDFETNSIQTLNEIFYNLSLDKKIGDFNNFLKIYKPNNEKLWNQYRNGKLKKEILRYKRFEDVLVYFGINDVALAKKIGDDYVYNGPLKKKLFPDTIEILEYLKKKYPLYIITNGFKEVQEVKMKTSDIDKYFQHVFISEDIGWQKPNIEIFNYVLKYVNAKPKDSLIIGDDLKVDILGAKNAGIDGVYFNPKKLDHNEKPAYEINCLIYLQKIL